METWLTQVEHHINLGATLVILAWIFKNHKVIVRGKDRMNTLWYRYCQITQTLYAPLENGKEAVMPPQLPRHQHGD